MKINEYQILVGCNILRFKTVQPQGHQSKPLILKYSQDLSFKLTRKVYLSSPILLHTTLKSDGINCNWKVLAGAMEELMCLECKTAI